MKIKVYICTENGEVLELLDVYPVDGEGPAFQFAAVIREHIERRFDTYDEGEEREVELTPQEHER